MKSLICDASISESAISLSLNYLIRLESYQFSTSSKRSTIASAKLVSYTTLFARKRIYGIARAKFKDFRQQGTFEDILRSVNNICGDKLLHCAL